MKTVHARSIDREKNYASGPGPHNSICGSGPGLHNCCGPGPGLGLKSYLLAGPGPRFQARAEPYYEFHSLVKEAQLSAMTTRNILSGFQHTGIFPFNRERFTEADFAPATLTDRDIPDANPMQLMADNPNELEANTSTTSIEVPQVYMIDSHETLQPGTSNAHAPRNHNRYRHCWTKYIRNRYICSPVELSHVWSGCRPPEN